MLEVDAAAIEKAGLHVFYGNVDEVGPGSVKLSSSRGIALVGEASAIHEAGARVESALAFVKGDYYVRDDIGTKEDLTRRTEHLRHLLAPTAKPSPLPLSVAAPDAAPSSSSSPEEMIG